MQLEVSSSSVFRRLSPQTHHKGSRCSWEHPCKREKNSERVKYFLFASGDVRRTTLRRTTTCGGREAPSRHVTATPCNRFDVAKRERVEGWTLELQTTSSNNLDNKANAIILRFHTWVRLDGDTNNSAAELKRFKYMWISRKNLETGRPQLFSAQREV